MLITRIFFSCILFSFIFSCSYVRRWASLVLKMGFPDSSVGKDSACNARDPRLIPGSGKSTGERIAYPLHYSWASFVALLIKNSPACRRPGFDPWVGKIPWRRERLSTLVFWPREFHGVHSPWGHKESGTTE